MSNIPTAEKFLQDHPLISHYYDDEFDWEVVPTEQVQNAMIEFAKLHVEAALKAAAENAEITNKPKFSGDYNPVVDEDSILNAYPLENIK